MKIYKYGYFAENAKNNELFYYAFDFDDNLLYLSTPIHMDKSVYGEWVGIDVSTQEWAQIRKDPQWRNRDNDIEKAMSEFRDFGPRGSSAFIDDAKEALDNKKYAPSWHKFIECLISGSIFAIITSRGHEPESIKNVIEYIIDTELTDNEQYQMYNNCLKFCYFFRNNPEDYSKLPRGKFSENKLIQDYLGFCYFYGVNSDAFKAEFGYTGAEKGAENAKEAALKEFSKKINNYGEKVGSKVNLGFSDDDVRTVNHIQKIFGEELIDQFPITYNIYDTSDRDIKGGVRKKIVRESSQQDIGLQSSVLPFTKWNNMTQRFYPSNDNPTDDYHNQMKNNVGQTNDLFDDMDIEFVYKRKKKKR